MNVVMLHLHITSTSVTFSIILAIHAVGVVMATITVQPFHGYI